MIQTLGPSLATALIAAAVFFYLWLRDRERYLAIWAVAWAIWVLRYAYGLWSAQVELVPGSFVLPTLALARGALMLWGTYALLDRRMPRPWLWVFAADFVVITAEAVSGGPLQLPGPPGQIHYLLFAAAITWSGVLFLDKGDLPAFEARVTGGALIVFGMLQTTYPLLATFPEWYTQSVYVVVYGLQILIPIGILMAYLRRAATEVDQLHVRLEQALTRVLAEHLPICAHCKAIREDDEWTRLEEYVSDRTETQFSHGICPTCLERHFPEVRGARAGP